MHRRGSVLNLIYLCAGILTYTLNFQPPWLISFLWKSFYCFSIFLARLQHMWHMVFCFRNNLYFSVETTPKTWKAGVKFIIWGQTTVNWGSQSSGWFIFCPVGDFIVNFIGLLVRYTACPHFPVLTVSFDQNISSFHIIGLYKTLNVHQPWETCST